MESLNVKTRRVAGTGSGTLDSNEADMFVQLFLPRKILSAG